MKNKILKSFKGFIFLVAFIVAAGIFYQLAYADVSAQWPDTSSPAAVKIKSGATTNRGARTSDGYYIIATENGGI